MEDQVHKRAAPLPAILPVLPAIADYTTEVLPLILGAFLALGALCLPGARLRIRGLDIAMLLAACYEVPSLWMSRLSANGVPAARTVAIAVLFYFAVRLAAGTPRWSSLAPALIGLFGAALAITGILRFHQQFQRMHVAGFSDIVALRVRLVAPSGDWIAGEWLTLVLATLPFAFASCLAARSEGRRRRAIVFACMTALIAAGLLLSCSRSIFWSLLAFPVFVAVLAVACRAMRAGAATALAALSLGAMAGLLLVVNAAYPGVADAYFHREISQTRSAEGRLAVWRRSAGVMKLAPVWGVGAGNAPLFLNSAADPGETTGFASKTFSLPVQILAEKGVIGATLYLAVLLLAARETRRKLRDPRVPPSARLFTCCIAAGLAAVLLRELTYSSLLERAPTAMIFAMGLALLNNEETASYP